MPDPLRELRGSAGRLEFLVDRPTGPPRAAVVLAHPDPKQCASMHTKAVYRTGKALARVGCIVLRFNFRGVGASAGTSGEEDGERGDFRAALDAMSTHFPGIPLLAAGVSFGAWVALEVGVADPRVTAVLAIGTPVTQLAGTEVPESGKTIFLVHGERDEITTMKAIRRFYAQLPEPKELIEVESASHLFEENARELGDAIEDLLAGVDLSLLQEQRL